MFKRIKKTCAVYLVPFVVMVAGTVGCGYLEEGFVCDQTISSRLAEKNEKVQPFTSVPVDEKKADLIYSVKVRTNSDLMVLYDRGIQYAIETIGCLDSSDFREEEIKSPLAIEKLCKALDLTLNEPIKPIEVDIFYCAKGKNNCDTAVYYSRGIDWTLEDSLISGSSSVFCVNSFRHLAYSNLPLKVGESYSNLKNTPVLESPSDIERLCSEMKKTNNAISFQSNAYTIERLNISLGKRDFYDVLHNKNPKKRFSKAVEELVDKTKDYRKEPFDQLRFFILFKRIVGWHGQTLFVHACLDKDEQYHIKRLNRLLLEESYPRETLNILIPSDNIMDFVAAVEKLFCEGKALAESECMVSNDLYILQESTDESKADVIIVGVITEILKQRSKVAFEKGLEEITKEKKGYLEGITKNKSQDQIEAGRKLLQKTFESLDTVRTELLKEIDRLLFIENLKDLKGIKFIILSK